MKVEKLKALIELAKGEFAALDASKLKESKAGEENKEQKEMKEGEEASVSTASDTRSKKDKKFEPGQALKQALEEEARTAKNRGKAILTETEEAFRLYLVDYLWGAEAPQHQAILEHDRIMSILMLNPLIKFNYPVRPRVFRMIEEAFKVAAESGHLTLDFYDKDLDITLELNHAAFKVIVYGIQILIDSTSIDEEPTWYRDALEIWSKKDERVPLSAIVLRNLSFPSSSYNTDVIERHNISETLAKLFELLSSAKTVNVVDLTGLCGVGPRRDYYGHITSSNPILEQILNMLQENPAIVELKYSLDKLTGVDDGYRNGLEYEVSCKPEALMRNTEAQILAKLNVNRHLAGKPDLEPCGNYTFTAPIRLRKTSDESEEEEPDSDAEEEESASATTGASALAATTGPAVSITPQLGVASSQTPSLAELAAASSATAAISPTLSAATSDSASAMAPTYSSSAVMP